MDAAISDGANTYSDLLPVLKTRQEEVNNHFEEAMGGVGQRNVAIAATHAGGWRAGRAAADLADLTLFDEVGPSASTSDRMSPARVYVPSTGALGADS